MRHDTEELLKGMELVISIVFCFITDEIIAEIACRITVSPILWGFPAFTIILLISYDAKKPSFPMIY